MIFILGIVFTISGVLLQTLPLSSKSALLIFSTAFIVIGLVSSTVYYKKYQLIKDLCSCDTPIIGQWSYPTNSTNSLKNFIQDRKSSTLATALLVLILALIFCIIFAYSGGPYILYLGYTFAMLSLLTFIIAQRFITTYYMHLLTSENKAIFAEDYIYFLDELYSLHKTLYFLQKVDIYLGQEYLLIFEYGLYDVDDPTTTYSLTLPIPQDKLQTATYLKHYYTDLIEPK